ncbi:MAG: IS200/IS605 family transposase [Betaproteobacteria bacterium]|nr:IS200/IS605 family transposase [Betaproteobacteria bacterium]
MTPLRRLHPSGVRHGEPSTRFFRFVLEHPDEHRRRGIENAAVESRFRRRPISVHINKLHHCTFARSYHFVFVTKYRRKCLTAEMLDRLKQIVTDLCESWGGRLVEMNGEADHVHLLLEMNPKAAPSVVANNFKTVTSRLLRRDYGAHLNRVYRKPVLWSRSYFVASCGGAPLPVIKHYIERQERPQ